MKTTECKKCGVSGLSWRKSAKGHWYLAQPALVSTLTHGNHITIPFAHQCVDAAKREARMLDFQKTELAALETKALTAELNEYELEALEYYKGLLAE
jgi:hypothetical protein